MFSLYSIMHCTDHQAQKEIDGAFPCVSLTLDSMGEWLQRGGWRECKGDWHGRGQRHQVCGGGSGTVAVEVMGRMSRWVTSRAWDVPDRDVPEPQSSLI